MKGKCKIKQCPSESLGWPKYFGCSQQICLKRLHLRDLPRSNVVEKITLVINVTKNGLHQTNFFDNNVTKNGLYHRCC